MNRFNHHLCQYWLIVLFIFIHALNLGAVNILTVQNPNTIV